MSELWKMLHIRALTFEGDNDDEFLKEFKKKIPSYQKCCNCSEFWDKYIVRYPPQTSKSEEYFEWTVKLHNIINFKLNKPILSIEDAFSIWQNHKI
jgi:SNF2 family DNA or RNA helicase